MRLNSNQLEKAVMEIGANQINPSLQPLRLDSVVTTFKAFMEQGTGVAYGHPGGVLLAMHSVDVFNGKRKAFEFLFLVDQVNKHPGAAATLLKEFEDGAREDGCETAVVGVHSGFSEWKILERFYNIKGYNFLSASLQKTL